MLNMEWLAITKYGADQGGNLRASAEMATEVHRMYAQKSAGHQATYDPAPRRYNPDTGEIEMAGAVRTNYSTPEALPDYLL